MSFVNPFRKTKELCWKSLFLWERTEIVENQQVRPWPSQVLQQWWLGAGANLPDTWLFRLPSLLNSSSCTKTKPKLYKPHMPEPSYTLSSFTNSLLITQYNCPLFCRFEKVICHMIEDTICCPTHCCTLVWFILASI